MDKKIKKELEEFKKFKENYKFEMLQLEEKDDCLYYKDVLVRDSEGNHLNESEYFINVGYKLKGPFSKVLSNLFPYEFKFKGKEIKSIEGIFQGLKFIDKKGQDLVFKYSGLDSNNIKVASSYDWKETGYLCYQGMMIDRFSKDYEDFCDEMYISALQNPLYRSVLKNCNKYILHSMGETDKCKTVFSRYEFERMLNTLSAFVKSK